MGDPRKITNKFEKPEHPWQKARIDAERELSKEFGLVNKKELWKMGSVLKGYKDRTKKLYSRTGEQAQIERNQLIASLKKFGLITEDNLDAVLGLELSQLMQRRLQSIVFKRKLARSMKHARQLITHEHVLVNGKKITGPGYIVSLAEESTVQYAPRSALMNEDHPERFIEKDLKKIAETSATEAKKKDAETVKKKIAEKVEEVKPAKVPETPKNEDEKETTEVLEKAPEKEKQPATPEEVIEKELESEIKVAEGEPAISDEEVEDKQDE